MGGVRSGDHASVRPPGHVFQQYSVICAIRPRYRPPARICTTIRKAPVASSPREDTISAHDDGLARYAVLRPEMTLEDLTEIYVVTSFDIVE